MRRTSILIAAIAVSAMATAGFAGARGRTEKLQLRRTSVGTILVNGRGFTIYVFTRDSRNKDTCQQLKGCANVWPPVTSSAKASAGSGVKSSLIGTITLKNGAKQVTYGGHPLYTYSGDGGPGQTAYVNFSAFGGRWPALSSSAQMVK